MREFDPKEQARLIFTEALRAVDAGAAVRRAVKVLSDSRLVVFDDVYKLTEKNTPIYAVAIGKAAYPMALALDDILGGKLNAGIISGVVPEESSSEKQSEKRQTLSPKWCLFAGGHPLPNEASLAAARSCFNLLQEANNQQAIIFFLISGGGSAMMEFPSDESITLADLREANYALVSCGASINEINIVRRCFSRIKGGGLSALVPLAAQISLIVSDTEIGDEVSVASGPTFEPEFVDSDEPRSIIKRYELIEKLPESILNSLTRNLSAKPVRTTKNLCRHYLLLDNQSAIDAAAACAKNFGLIVDIALDISQQHVENGCLELVNRMNDLRESTSENKIACLFSGGEFACPVRGNGMGGRNSETTLQMALMLDNKNSDAETKVNSAQIAFLSAGTDGTDGNSFAAGAVCDNLTIGRARHLNLDAQLYLEASDSFTFFQKLGDTIITRPTGTNVRDLRIMIARK
jgi:glycerate-2-kinase